MGHTAAETAAHTFHRDDFPYTGARQGAETSYAVGAVDRTCSLDGAAAYSQGPSVQRERELALGASDGLVRGTELGSRAGELRGQLLRD